MRESDLVLVIQAFKVLELVIKMIFLSWILAIIFFYFTIYVDDNDMDTNECTDYSMMDYNFKDDDPCIKNKNYGE